MPEPIQSLAAALLTGGRSTRMGQDKATLVDMSGRPLWQNRLDLLEASGADEIMISCHPTQTWLCDAGLPLVYDQWPNTGPLGGIVSCLQSMQSGRLLVLAVDLPGVTQEVLNALIKSASPLVGAVFHHDGMLEPLVAIYPRKMALAGRQRLETGQFSLRDWIIDAGKMMSRIPLPDRWVPLLANVNDPASWQRWLESQNGSRKLETLPDCP